MMSMTDTQRQEWEKQIDAMSAEDCLRLQRFALSGHPIFNSDEPLYDYFKRHFDKLGGITPELSKRVGW